MKILTFHYILAGGLAYLGKTNASHFPRVIELICLPMCFQLKWGVVHTNEVCCGSSFADIKAVLEALVDQLHRHIVLQGSNGKNLTSETTQKYMISKMGMDYKKLQVYR